MAKDDETAENHFRRVVCRRKKESWVITGADAQYRESSGTMPADGDCAEYKENDPVYEGKKADSDGAVGFF